MKFCLIIALAGVCFAQRRDAEFNRLADRYFDEVLLRCDSVQGTAAGFHQYDTQLPSGARSEIQAQISALKKFEAEVANFDGS